MQSETVRRQLHCSYSVPREEVIFNFMQAFHNFVSSFGLQAMLSLLRFVGPNCQGTGGDTFNAVYDLGGRR